MMHQESPPEKNSFLEDLEQLDVSEAGLMLLTAAASSNPLCVQKGHILADFTCDPRPTGKKHLTVIVDPAAAALTPAPAVPRPQQQEAWAWTR